MTKKLTIPLILIISFNLVQASVDPAPISNTKDVDNTAKSFNVSAPENRGGVDLGGYIQTDDRVRIKDWTVPWQEYRLALNINYRPDDRVRFFSEIWLRSCGFSNVNHSADLADKQKVAPWDLDFREAYVDLSGFLFPNLDLRIGKQRIAWGTADKLNPTDNLNPNDFEDIWDFGRHLGSNSIKASYYINDLSITGVFVPTFTPAVLPMGDWLQALMPTLILPTYFAYQNIADTIIMPSNKLKERSSWGAKISKNLFGYDFSVSYINGRYDLPMLRKLIFTPAGLVTVNLLTQLVYPKMQVIGTDMAGSIKSVGVWAEAAMFIPEKTLVTTDMSALGLGVFDTVALDNTPYFRYIIGLDYTFKNGIYINTQYLRGFANERGKNNLEDYLMIGLDYKFLDDKLKLSPINSAIEIKQWNDFKNNYAFVLSPEVSYYPTDGAEIVLGFRWLEGKTATTFGHVKTNDEISLKVKYSF